MKSATGIDKDLKDYLLNGSKPLSFTLFPAAVASRDEEEDDDDMWLEPEEIKWGGEKMKSEGGEEG